MHGCTGPRVRRCKPISTHNEWVTRGLILDFGKVLVREQPPQILDEMAELAGLDRLEFERRYWHFRPAYDGGQPADDYWQRVLEDSAVGRAEIPRVISSLKDADARSWTDYRESMWQLTADFRARGGRTAFLSNGVPEVMARVRAQRQLQHYFDVVIVSYEVGYTKPDPRIYELCLAELNVPANDTVFVDDRIQNIEGAKRARLRTVWFLGDESVAEVKRALE